MTHLLLHVGLGEYIPHSYQQGVFDIAPNEELKDNSYVFGTSITQVLGDIEQVIF